MIVSQLRGKTACALGATCPQKCSKPVPVLGSQDFSRFRLEAPGGVLERFCGVKKTPGGMTKILGGVTKNLGGVTKTSGRPAGKFCHMKKNIVGQKKCGFGEYRKLRGASRRFRDVSGRFGDASGAFFHESRKFCGVAGSKPRAAARFQAPSIAQLRHPKNVCASGDRSALGCVSKATAKALV